MSGSPDRVPWRDSGRHLYPGALDALLYYEADWEEGPNQCLLMTAGWLPNDPNPTNGELYQNTCASVDFSNCRVERSNFQTYFQADDLMFATSLSHYSFEYAVILCQSQPITWLHHGGVLTVSNGIFSLTWNQHGDVFTFDFTLPRRNSSPAYQLDTMRNLKELATSVVQDLETDV